MVKPLYRASMPVWGALMRLLMRRWRPLGYGLPCWLVHWARSFWLKVARQC